MPYANKQDAINYYKEWRKNNPTYNRNWRHKNPDYQERYKSKSPEKFLARAEVNKALRKGLIEKKNCFCGETLVEAHHDDYTKPLEIKWFCRQHHEDKHHK